MNPKKYSRLEMDGQHWPDSDIGDNLLYGINFADYFVDSSGTFSSTETIVSATWELSTGLSSSDDFIQGDIAFIKISSDTIGVFKAICTLNTIVDGKTQINKVPMMLTVY